MRAGWSLLFACCIGACSAERRESTGTSPLIEAGVTRTRSELLDPKACRACHLGHYLEWEGSMHAYAAEDPVFLAMNRRGQEETNGALGDFCVNCHAPMAVREGLTDDGLNLPELPQQYRGVTCYFCHNAVHVDGDFNNPIELANDLTMRGPLAFAEPTSAHRSAYSELLDSRELASAKMCGACHDVVLPATIAPRDFHLERTFDEWRGTLFNRPVDEGGVTCNGCHMPVSAERSSVVSGGQARPRSSRRHDFEGVDLAITDFPGRERQRLLVEQFLASSLLAELCVSETGLIELTLENVGSGHHWPSGAAHDREAWIELVAYGADPSTPVFETGTHPERLDGAAVLKDSVIDSAGEPAHMFWDVAGLERTTTIPGVITRDPLDRDFHAERRVLRFDSERADWPSIERVELRVRVRPIALAVLEDLVDSGHLEAAVLDEMPVLDVLPGRCIDEATAARFDALVAAPARCDEDADFTLVWRREAASAEGPRSRRTTIEGAPAACYAHPTYAAVPPVQGESTPSSGRSPP